MGAQFRSRPRDCVFQRSCACKHVPFHIASLLPQLLNTAPQQLSHPSPPAAGSANPKLHPGRCWSSLGSSDLIPISWTALPSPEQHHWVSPAAWVPPHLSSLPGKVLVSPFPGCSASLPTTLVPPPISLHVLPSLSLMPLGCCHKGKQQLTTI